MAAASLTRDFMMFDYVMQLKVACERIRADNERRVQRYVPELERYAAEAFRNPGDILTPPPQCHPPDVAGEAARLMHANFGILWTSMKCKEPAPAAAHSSVVSSTAAGSSGCETGRAAASVASSVVAPAEALRAGREDLCCSPGKHKASAQAGSGTDFGSPSKRPRTFLDVDEPARPALAEPAREAFAATSGGFGREASLPQEALTSFAKSLEKVCEKGPDRSVRQGPLGAPSPCRAQRLGPMPSSPPQRPPPDQPQGAPGRGGWGLRLEEELPQPEQPRGAAPVEATASAAQEPAAEAQPPLTARSFAPPAAFAMPSTRAAMAEEPLSPATPVPEFSAPNAWQRSALFAPPPPSPAPAAAGGAAAGLAPSAGRVPPVALPPAPVPPPPPAAAAATEPRAQEVEEAQQPHAGEVTPVPVSQRIMMFETRSTPCLRQPGAPPVPPGGSGQSRLRNGVAPGGSGGAVNGNSMFTPLRASASGVKPKELFRSHSELARGGAKPAAQAPQSARVVRPPFGSANAGTASSAANSSTVAGHGASDSTAQAAPRALERVEAFERLAAGSRRDDVAKPKSLKAAELAKQQEERKQRERQEERQERERVRGLGANASTSTLGTAAASGGASAAAAPASARKVRGDTTPVPPPPTSLHPALPAAAPSAEDAPAPAAAASSSEIVPRALHFPPVPSFGPEPHVLLRQIGLPPKCDEDNYEISDADSEEDAEKSRDRTHKHIPKWSQSYLEELGRQAGVDPDTIFASRVPKCDLETIFSDALYEEVGKSRPRRPRGSSGDWKKDRLTRAEVQGYKSRMGHIRSWEEEKAVAVAGASAD